MQAQSRVREALRKAEIETPPKAEKTENTKQAPEKKRPATDVEDPEKSKKPKKGGKKPPLVPPDEIFQLQNASTLDATKVQDSGLDFKVSIAQLNPKPGSFNS